MSNPKREAARRANGGRLVCGSPMHGSPVHGSLVHELTVCGWVVCVLLTSGLAGCTARSGGDSTMLVTPTAVRAERRAYSGAPPVIPHKPLGAACVTCHTETGKHVPELGMAPANPHQHPEHQAATSNCRQCHLFQRSTESFVANSFAGLRPASLRGERLFPGAPPTIPHTTQMRQTCNACHSGPSARPDIACSHPQRTNCLQCHLTTATW